MRGMLDEREREELRTIPIFWGAGGPIYCEEALPLQSQLDMPVICGVSKWPYDFRGQGRGQPFFTSRITLEAQWLNLFQLLYFKRN